MVTADDILNQNPNGEPVKVWTGKQSEYDALSPDSDTVYFILADPPPEEESPFSSGNNPLIPGGGGTTGEPEPEPQPAPVPWSDVTAVQDVTVTGGPRTLEPYNPDTFTRLENHSLWVAYFPRRFTIDTTFNSDGTFETFVTDRFLGIGGTTPLFSGNWRDSAVPEGTTYTCGIELNSLNGIPVTRNDRTSLGYQANAELLDVNGVDVTVFQGGTVIQTEVSSTEGGTISVAFEEHSDLQNREQDSMHLDSTVVLSGVGAFSLFVTGVFDGTEPSTHTQEFNVIFDMAGEGQKVLLPWAQSVLININDEFSGDPDPRVDFYTLDVAKPKQFHDGADAIDEVLVTAPSGVVEFHFMHYSTLTHTVMVEFGAGWNDSGSTIALTRGQSYQATVGAGATNGQILPVTISTTIGDQTYTKEVPVSVFVFDFNFDFGGGR